MAIPAVNGFQFVQSRALPGHMAPDASCPPRPTHTEAHVLTTGRLRCICIARRSQPFNATSETTSPGRFICDTPEGIEPVMTRRFLKLFIHRADTRRTKLELWLFRVAQRDRQWQIQAALEGLVYSLGSLGGLAASANRWTAFTIRRV